MVPPIPIGQRQARGVGLALSTIGSLVWDAKKRPIKKKRDGRDLDLRWPRFDEKKNNQLGVGVSGGKDVGEEARVG